MVFISQIQFLLNFLRLIDLSEEQIGLDWTG
jgi:hypothetical protein